jgi:hypothetical protein
MGSDDYDETLGPVFLILSGRTQQVRREKRRISRS